MNTIRLTEFSHGGGCGCKIAPAVLEKILGTNRQSLNFPSLLSGNEGNEDSAAWQLSEEEVLLSTTDFFMPVVDSPEDFGAIAASNALSDIYAMGGKPIFALAILGWPVEKLDVSIAKRVLDSARNVCGMAGIPIAGGHSIDSPEPIFGLAVNGLAKTTNLKRNNTAQKGDLLFLTKRLGVGMITTAAKRKKIEEEILQGAIQQMRKLNLEGYEIAALEGVHALTDVTGFGLAGHLFEMASGSGLQAEIQWSALPRLNGAEFCIQNMIYPDMTMKNFNAYKTGYSEMDVPSILLMCDPQTSGGLLISASQQAAPAVSEILKRYGSHSEPIGRFTEAGQAFIRINP